MSKNRKEEIEETLQKQKIITSTFMIDKDKKNKFTVEIDFTICKWQLVDSYTLDKKIEEESLRMK